MFAVYTVHNLGICYCELNVNMNNSSSKVSHWGLRGAKCCLGIHIDRAWGLKFNPVCLRIRSFLLPPPSLSCHPSLPGSNSWLRGFARGLRWAREGAGVATLALESRGVGGNGDRNRQSSVKQEGWKNLKKVDETQSRHKGRRIENEAKD